MQKLSMDIELRVLNDLDEKVHRLKESMVEPPDLSKVVFNSPAISWMCLTYGHMVMTCGKEKYFTAMGDFAGYFG